MIANLSIAQGIGLSLAVLACFCDLRTRRIPQVLTLGGAVAGIAFHVVTGGWTAGAISLVGWTIGILIFLAPFALGGLGGGDVKLLGALGAWFGPTEAIWLALYAGAVGLVLAVLYSLATGYLKTAVTNVIVLLTFWRVNGVKPLPEMTLAHGTGPRMAYALPILAGAVMTVWLR
jgi:prepilin peptidase CpaA